MCIAPPSQPQERYCLGNNRHGSNFPINNLALVTSYNSTSSSPLSNLINHESVFLSLTVRVKRIMGSAGLARRRVTHTDQYFVEYQPWFLLNVRAAYSMSPVRLFTEYFFD